MKSKASYPKQSRITVLHLTQYFSVGGLERVVLQLATEQNNNSNPGSSDNVKIKPMILVYDRIEGSKDASDLTSLAQEAGLEVIAFYRKGRGLSIRLILYLLRLVLSKKVQIVHTHDLGPLVYAAFVKMLTLGQLRILHTQHGLPQNFESKKNLFYLRFFSNWFVNKITVVSQDLKAHYRKWNLSKLEIEVIPNGIPFPMEIPNFAERKKRRISDDYIQGELAKQIPDVSQDTLSEWNQKTWMIYMARFNGGKGQDLFLEAWKTIPKAIRQHFLVLMMGPNTEPQYLAGLKKNLNFFANEPIYLFNPTLQPERWLASADISLSFSEFEGYPVAPMEALAQGCFLLLSDIPGHQHLQLYAHYVRIKSINQTKDLLDCLLSCQEQISSPTAQQLRSRKALWRLARQQFGQRKMFQAYRRCYQSLLDKDFISGKEL